MFSISFQSRLRTADGAGQAQTPGSGENGNEDPYLQPPDDQDIRPVDQAISLAFDPG